MRWREKVKIVVAPDSFKESLKASEAAEAIEMGIKRVFPQAEVVKVPLSDGGEGMAEALIEAQGGRLIRKKVTSPLGDEVEAYFGILKDEPTAIIEMAQASGLSLVPQEKRNPLFTTTYGTGELIEEALNRGCKRIIVGVGGSATVDGGAGMAQALGAKLLDEKGMQVPFGGGNLERIASVDMGKFDPRIRDTEVIVACDVDNSLCGEHGAAKVYGPQKGATPQMVEILDKNLLHFTRVIEKFLNKAVKDIPGTGAAGGLAAGLVVFLDAQIKPGIQIVMEASHLKEKMRGADLAISGEGRIDEQTFYGKAPMGLVRMARKRDIPVILFGGEVRVDTDILCKCGVDVLISTVDRITSLEEALKNSRSALMNASQRAMRLIKIGCLSK